MTNFNRDFERLFPESASIPESLVTAIANGNYAAVSKEDIERHMRKSEVASSLISQLAEAHGNGASPIVINVIAGSIAAIRKDIIRDIIKSRSCQEVARWLPKSSF